MKITKWTTMLFTLAGFVLGLAYYFIYGGIIAQDKTALFQQEVLVPGLLIGLAVGLFFFVTAILITYYLKRSWNFVSFFIVMLLLIIILLALVGYLTFSLVGKIPSLV